MLTHHNATDNHRRGPDLDIHHIAATLGRSLTGKSLDNANTCTASNTAPTPDVSDRATVMQALESDTFNRIPHAINRFLIDKKITPVARLLMQTLVGVSWGYRYTHGDPAGRLIIQKSRAWLQHEAGLSRHQYDDAARQLEAQHLITRTQTRHPTNPHRQGFSIIEIMLPDALRAHVRKRGARTTSISVSTASGRKTSGQPSTAAPRSRRPKPAVPSTSPTSSTSSTARTTTPRLMLTPAEVDHLLKQNNRTAALWRTTSPPVRKQIISGYRDWLAHDKQGNLLATIGQALATSKTPDTEAGGNIAHARAEFEHALRHPTHRAAHTRGSDTPAGGQSGSAHQAATASLTVDATVVTAIRARLLQHYEKQRLPHVPAAHAVDIIGRLTNEVAWSITLGCFAGSGQPISKSINAACKLIRQQRWGTPYGFSLAYMVETPDGGRLINVPTQS